MADICLIQAVGDPFKLLLAVLSLTLAAVILIVLKKYNFSNKTKVGLIYSHLIAVFFPFGLFSTSAVCGFLCLPCYSDPVGLALAALPTTFLFSTFAGFVVIPLYYITSNRRMRIKEGFVFNAIRKYAKKIGIKQPAVFITDNAKPLAFSFRYLRSSVFLSQGMMDVFNRKEKEAVIIHELAHLKFSSSLFKLSTFLIKFSPLSLLKSFNQELNEEERKADDMVYKIQGTNKHLISAKSKIAEWEERKKN